MQDRKLKVTETIKADRQLMQRLFNASRAGQVVELHNVLKHKLSVVPLSLGSTYKKMKCIQKVCNAHPADHASWYTESLSGTGDHR